MTKQSQPGARTSNMRRGFALVFVLASLLVASVCGYEQGNHLVVRLRGGAEMEGWHPRAVEELSPPGGNACYQACLAREECTSWTSVAAGCATWTAALTHIALSNLTGGEATAKSLTLWGCRYFPLSSTNLLVQVLYSTWPCLKPSLCTRHRPSDTQGHVRAQYGGFSPASTPSAATTTTMT